ncbi:substrate-binding domain-containing protein [Citricoccus sp. GCM10030269]|uniref:substrate-binding domain-containing protein n=1 Tax=Citricoccus sp. GCM10030269 TaxID=3273388 RepID=UPI00361F8451
MKANIGHGRQSNHRTALLTCSAVASLSLVLSGCSGQSGPAADAGDSAGSGDHGTAAALQGDCGTVPTVEPNDPDDLLAEESPELKELFNGFPYRIDASAWADAGPLNDGEPATVGYLQLDSGSTYANAFAGQITASFKEAESEGLVDRLIVQNPGGTGGSVTAADQLRAYSQLVQDGADIIIAQPVSGDAFVQAVNDAGKKGIPTVTWTGFIPSEYAVDVAPNTFTTVAEPVSRGLEKIDGEGNVMIVQGMEGMSVNTVSVESAKRVIGLCPDVSIVGTPAGDFSEAAAKSAVSTFLATHPQEIDMAYQVASMGTGVFSAFDSAGRSPMPIVVDHIASAASLAWWKKLQPDGYEGIATGGNGKMGAEAVFDISTRIIEGEGPKFNHIVTSNLLITEDNLDDFAVPDATTTSSEEIQSHGELLPQEQTDLMFTHPGE